ncbi:MULTISPECIES: ABC transporter ATP-binding protein [Streptomyces]|uniref:ABC transporter ATP-binding protein n=1 Tax=Streptomyces TaxID=1883 RepID=UPI000CD50D0F|nr:ABC transporter ATP-binding protein [Streptomyces sp. SM11]
MTLDTGTVSVKHLSVKYRRTVAVDDLTLSLASGVTGLLGPNGAGKTTLLRALATARLPETGDLRVFGLDPRQAGPRRAIRRRLGFLPQSSGFHSHFTAFEFVDYVAILKEMRERKQRHDEVRRVLEAVGLADERNKKMKALSGGMRQRAGLAAALVGNPDLLILDEPTVGLDPEQRMRFRELIADLGVGRTVLLSTHQTEDVAALCRRVLVMGKGRINFDGAPDGLARLAEGKVWVSSDRDPTAVAGWRTGLGEYRNIGVPPSGARLGEPTLEDGYLLLHDAVPGNEASVS